jgi:hypothetical protein
VDRENKIILEYRAKNAYRIEPLGCSSGVYQFRLVNGFNETVSGQSVRVTTPHGEERLRDSVSRQPTSTLTTGVDGSGVFGIELEPYPIPTAPDPTPVTIQAGSTKQDFNLPRLVCGIPTTCLNFTSNFTQKFGVNDNLWSTVEIQAACNSSPVKQAVIWTVEHSSVTDLPAWLRGNNNIYNGLAWGSMPISLPINPYNSPTDPERGDMSGNVADGGGGATEPNGDYVTPGDTVALTDIVGSRKVTVKASVDINSDGIIDQMRETAKIDVTFGAGPLSVFYAPVDKKITWLDAYAECNPNYTYPANSKGQTYPASPGDWKTGTGYVGGGDNYAGGKGGMPFIKELQRVSGRDATNNPTGLGAAYAAGWPDKSFWAGEARDLGYAPSVGVADGFRYNTKATDPRPIIPFVCRRW